MCAYLASYLSVYLTSYLACYLESHVPPRGLPHVGTIKNTNGLLRVGTLLDLGEGRVGRLERIYRLNTSVTMFHDDFTSGKLILFILHTYEKKILLHAVRLVVMGGHLKLKCINANPM